MAFIKGTSFYKASTPTLDFGWSESIYMMNQDLKGALNDFNALVLKRLQLLGSGVSHRGVKVSDDLVFMDSLVESGVQPKQATPPCYNADFNTLPADFAYSGFHCRVENTDQPYYRRSLVLSGLSDVFQDTTIETFLDSSDANQAKLSRAYEAWRRVLINGKYAMKVWDIDPAGNPEKKILKIAQPGDLFNVTAHGLVPGDQIRVRLAKTTGASINGILTVDTVPDPDHFTVLDIPSYTKYVGKGVIRKRVRKLVPINHVNPLRFVKRNRGSNYLKPVGRRKHKK